MIRLSKTYLNLLRDDPLTSVLLGSGVSPTVGPGFAATAAGRRLKELNTIDSDALLLCSREGTPLMTIAAKRSQATLCLLTALSIHDLTDEIPTRSNIAIPRGTKPLTVWSAPIRWHHFHAATFDIGRTEHALPGGRVIGLYSEERTIIDLFRLSRDWGSDLANDALKRWLRARGNSPSRLLKMAKSFPKGKPALQNALEILL